MSKGLPTGHYHKGYLEPKEQNRNIILIDADKEENKTRGTI